jgi:hypothetical protein
MAELGGPSHRPAAIRHRWNQSNVPGGHAGAIVEWPQGYFGMQPAVRLSSAAHSVVACGMMNRPSQPPSSDPSAATSRPGLD